MKTTAFRFMAILLAAMIVLAGCGNNSGSSGGEDGIKIGILLSSSGPTALIEAGMIKTAMMAIEEINEKGGVNGKKLIPIQEDYAGDPSMAATKAKKLVMEDKVTAVLGTFTSASRQAVLPIIEQNNSLLIYPNLYEGEEYSENVIYTGPIPNQGLEKFIPWLVENKGKKFFFIGSDYVFPIVMNKQAKALLEMHGGEVVGEEYVPFGHMEFASLINKIKEAKPDIVFSTVVAESESAFFKQFHDYGITADDILIASPIPTENDLAAMGPEAGKGHVVIQAYFQSVDTPENKVFLENYEKKYGKEPVNTQMEAVYYSIYLLAAALEKAGDSSDTKQIIDAFAGLEFQAPSGKIKVDEENHHTYLNYYVGVGNLDGQFDIIGQFEPVRPEPWSKLLYPNHEEPWKK
jgi:branched-chain amino acid transport system substrate-binding protein/urea transport system substrate-binding protein